MGRIDAIVTDMPYGKSSYTAKEPLRSLYERSFEKFNELLKPEGRAVVCTNRLDYLLSSAMKLDSLHKLYVNKSMSRWIGVFTLI
jgi:tRNA (guanine10-N2)-dimethyltransferase